MNRISTPAAGVLSALLALGLCGSASAQTVGPDRGKAQHDEHEVADGASAGPAAARSRAKVTTQEELDAEKAMLKGQVNTQIDAADANIDVLKKMSQTDKDPTTKKKHDDMEKQLLSARGRLEKDLTKIDRAKMDDWSSVRPAVQRDVTAANSQLQRVSATTKVPAPTTGAANKQPTGP